MQEKEIGELRWSVHLARREPVKTAAVILVALLAGLLGVAVIGSAWMLPVCALALLLFLADFLLPVRYEVGREGAKSCTGFGVTAIRWQDVRRVIEGEDGVKLSPLAASSRLAPFRGVFLRADGNKQEILEAIAYWRSQHAGDLGNAADGRTDGENNREGGGGG